MTARNSVFQTMVALQASRGEATPAEIAARHNIEPRELAAWQRRLAGGAARWAGKSGQGFWLWSSPRRSFP